MNNGDVPVRYVKEPEYQRVDVPVSVSFTVPPVQWFFGFASADCCDDFIQSHLSSDELALRSAIFLAIRMA